MEFVSNIISDSRYVQKKTKENQVATFPPPDTRRKKHNLLTSNHPRHYRGSNKTQWLREIASLPDFLRPTQHDLLQNCIALTKQQKSQVNL